MYFVANEWIKLATKRKCSIGIQILMVLITIIVRDSMILIEIENEIGVLF